MKLKYIFAINLFIAAGFLLFMNCGGEEKSVPTSPIFSDVETIEIGQDGSKFTYYLPSDVAFAVLGVFSSVNIEIESDGRAVKDDNLIGGSRTGMPSWGRSDVLKSNLYNYNPSTYDFNGSSPYSLPAGTGYYWAIWGYDKYGNLTHASGKLKVSP